MFKSGVVQAKPRIGRPGVIYEKDADRAAKQVMQIPDPPVQRQTEEKEELQRNAEPVVPHRQETEKEEEEVLQGKFTPSEASAQLEGDGGEAENRNGMPHSLKAGLEALSGMDLSGVRVHYNASKPAQLNSLAYTQGHDIHVGPGQEKHLPHEGWHAVQQRQGRVTCTMQAKGVAINDDFRLEREADVMGAKASQATSSFAIQSSVGKTPVKGLIWNNGMPRGLMRVVQRQRLPGITETDRLAISRLGNLRGENLIVLLADSASLTAPPEDRRWEHVWGGLVRGSEGTGRRAYRWEIIRRPAIKARIQREFASRCERLASSERWGTLNWYLRFLLHRVSPPAEVLTFVKNTIQGASEAVSVGGGETGWDRVQGYAQQASAERSARRRSSAAAIAALVERARVTGRRLEERAFTILGGHTNAAGRAHAEVLVQYMRTISSLRSGGDAWGNWRAGQAIAEVNRSQAQVQMVEAARTAWEELSEDERSVFADQDAWQDLVNALFELFQAEFERFAEEHELTKRVGGDANDPIEIPFREFPYSPQEFL